MAIKAILFDLDGTLVDSNDRHVTVWDAVLRAAGHVFPLEALHAQIGKGGDNYLPTLIPGIADAERERLDTRHGDLFKTEQMPQVRPFPQAHALLAAVRARGQQVVLASSAGGEEVEHYVDLLDAKDIVSATTSKDDAARSKPDPDIFAAALAAAEVAAEEAVVVGDTPWDVIAANRCGIASVGVLSGGFAEAALREAGAVAIYRDVAELLDQLEQSPLAG